MFSDEKPIIGKWSKKTLSDVGEEFCTSQRQRSKTALQQYRHASQDISSSFQTPLAAPMVSVVKRAVPAAGVQTLCVQVLGSSSVDNGCEASKTAVVTVKVPHSARKSQHSSSTCRQLLTNQRESGHIESSALLAGPKVRQSHDSEHDVLPCIYQTTNQLLGNTASSEHRQPIVTAVTPSTCKGATSMSHKKERKTSGSKSSKKRKGSGKVTKSVCHRSEATSHETSMAETDVVDANLGDFCTDMPVDFTGDAHINSESETPPSQMSLPTNSSISVLKKSKPKGTSTPIVALRTAQGILSPMSQCGSSPRLKICGAELDQEEHSHSVMDVKDDTIVENKASQETSQPTTNTMQNHKTSNAEDKNHNVPGKMS